MVVALTALLALATVASTDAALAAPSGLSKPSSVNLATAFPAPSSETSLTWSTLSFDGSASSDGLKSLSWDLGVGPYFTHFGNINFAACQAKCAKHWVCAGIYFGPVVKGQSKKCVLMASTYRLLAASPERFYGLTGSSSELVLAMVDQSTSLYHVYKANYMTSARTWADLVNFVPAMTYWDIMGKGVGDETLPYVGLRPNTLFTNFGGSDTTWSSGYDESATGSLSFPLSRAPEPLTGLLEEEDPFVSFSEEAFIPASQNKGLIKLTFAQSEEDGGLQSCGDIGNKLTYPRRDIWLAFSRRSMDAGYIECALYATIAAFSQTDSLFFQNSTSVRGLFVPPMSTVAYEPLVPSHYGEDFTWPASLTRAGAYAWNASNIARGMVPRVSESVTSGYNAEIWVRESLVDSLTLLSDLSPIYLLDCAEASSSATSAADFCSVGTGVRAVSPFATGTTLVLDRPNDFSWDAVKCRAMCRFNKDFCLGFNLYNGNCELLTDEALISSLEDLQWPAAGEVSLDCVAASSLEDCSATQVQPYRISTSGTVTDHSEFITEGCRVQLKTVRNGNCVGAIKDDLVYTLEVPSTNIEVFDECSALCCDNEWCAGLEYIVASDENPLYTKCNFVMAADVASIDNTLFRVVTYEGRKIKLWRAARQLTTNTQDTTITCVTKSGIVSPYGDTGSSYLYTGGARCMGASANAPITISFDADLTEDLTAAEARALLMSSAFELDDEKITYCRDYCEEYSTLCKGFMVTFGTRTDGEFKCTMYTSIESFLDFEVNAFAQVWQQFWAAGSLFVGSKSISNSADGFTWAVSQLYQYITHPERDSWHIVATSVGSETVVSSVCYSRYDYSMLFSSDSTVSSDYTAIYPAVCDSETAYVLRHRSNYAGSDLADDLKELCENLCSENPLICRGFMINSTEGDCTLYVNWDYVSLDEAGSGSSFHALKKMEEVETALVNHFRFTRFCSALDGDESTCEGVAQDNAAITDGVAVTGANLTCYINTQFIEPVSVDSGSINKIVLIICTTVGTVLFLGVCCWGCDPGPEHFGEEEEEEEEAKKRFIKIVH